MDTMKSWRLLCTGGSGFIGTHFCDDLIEKGVTFINVDKQAPRKESHRGFWRNTNILDVEGLQREFAEFQPTHVVHLAARAVLEGNSLDDFVDNTVGTKNVLEAVRNTPGVSRVIITSSQHVFNRNGRMPANDLDFAPYGLYGQSKVITENVTREANLACCWTIIRPTSVWGAWHSVYVPGLWTVMKKGLYFHPSGDSVVRGYGYVRNVVWQMEKILQAPAELVNQKLFYVGDAQTRQIEWVNAFSKALTGRDVRLFPKQVIHLLALMGDFLSLFSIKFPMYGDRYRNLTSDNPVPMQPVLDAFGPPPCTLREGVDETVEWLRSQGDFWK
jgi:GlcNAc-P-P-Und epimerase